MNEFVGWDLKHDDKEKECGKCGMKEGKAGCCKDEHKQLKLSDDQNHNQLKGLVFNQFFTQVLLTYSYNYTFAQPATVAITFPKNNAPPPWRSVPIYLSNCVFLI